MRRAYLTLCLFCASAVLSPVAFTAAADTGSRAGSVVVKTVTTLPPAVHKKATPPSATPLPASDPHPFSTEFFGPARKPSQPLKAPARTSQVLQHNAIL